MLYLALFAQLIQVPDSVAARAYATPALREFVARASRANRAPPLTLAGYTARVESELAFILRDTLGREIVGQIEQLAARADWARDGRYDLHVVGYRAQSLGAPYSALTFTRMYSAPVLYGNRLYIGMNDGVPRTRSDSVARRKRIARDSAEGRTPYRAVHPLAVDRDRYYRFSGGDTAAILHAGGRVIRIVRVMAEPIADRDANFAGFHGELDFDADRYQLVRMRGRFVSMTTRKDPLLVRSTGAVAIAYVEFENAEVDGRYWLPSVQRSEFQAQMGLLGDTRPIYRIVTRFREHAPRDTTILLASADSIPVLAPLRSRLTFAKSDTASHYDGWQAGLGAMTGSVRGDDFDDLAPDVWRPTGRPRASLWPSRLEDVARYNRVEGMFTGVAGQVRFRDLAPGLTARGSAGWAWSEGTARGAIGVSLARARWITSARAERSLATTNDFLLTLETGLSIGPLLVGVNDYDYADRWMGALAVSRIFRTVDRAILTSEMAYVRDRAAARHVISPPLGGQPFRENRGVLPGDYARSTTTLEVHPRVTGDALSPGLGARVTWEVAAGDLDWRRAEVRVAARKYRGGFMFASRLDGGMVFGDRLPPQALYELGGGQDLPSYGYKEFGGDRAALGRALAAYQFPVFRTPRRVWRVVIPGLSPGVGVGAQGGWAEASSPAARAALLSLGGDGVTPISRPTERVRATADVRLTVLSGAIGAGFARPIDHAGRWRPFFVWGASF